MFWNGLFSWLGGSSNFGSTQDGLDDSGCSMNPATGLPMINGCAGVDVGGSSYGLDMHQDDAVFSINSGLNDDAWASPSAWDDSFFGGISSWDE